MNMNISKTTIIAERDDNNIVTVRTEYEDTDLEFLKQAKENPNYELAAIMSMFVEGLAEFYLKLSEISKVSQEEFLSKLSCEVKSMLDRNIEDDGAVPANLN